VDLKLEPVTIAYALLLALVAAALIGLLPALKATRMSVQRGLQGITSTCGTMKFGGIWSDSLTVDLLLSSVITSVIMAAVGVLACAAPARRALRIQPTEALRQV